MSKTSFLEEFIFAKYKDKYIGNAKKFKGLIKKNYKDVDADEIYRRVINYQVATYDGGLANDCFKEASNRTINGRATSREYATRRRRIGR